MPLSTPSVDDVRSIITTTQHDGQVNAAIETATLVAEDCASILAASEARQKAIVKYLAAHFLHVTDMSNASSKSKAITSRSLGDASESYAAAPLGTQLESSQFGQQALILDTGGCLATKGKRRAMMRVL